MISSILVPPFRLAVRAFVAGAVLAVPAVAKEAAAPASRRFASRGSRRPPRSASTAGACRTSTPQRSGRLLRAGLQRRARPAVPDRPLAPARLGQLAESSGPTTWSRTGGAAVPLSRRHGSRVAHLQLARHAERGALTAFVAGINAYVEWLEANPAKLPREFKLPRLPAREMGAPRTWSASARTASRATCASEVARAHTLCGEDVEADAGPLRPHPTGRRRSPRGSIPACRRTCSVFQLATQGVRLTRVDPSGAASGAPAHRSLSALTGAARRQQQLGRRAAQIGDRPRHPGQRPAPRLLRARACATSCTSSRRAWTSSAPGEPALPGISSATTARIAFGLTIFSIDQEDLYVYETQPGRPRPVPLRRAAGSRCTVSGAIPVKGAAPREVELELHPPRAGGPRGRREAPRLRRALRLAGAGHGALLRLPRATCGRRTSTASSGARWRWGAPTLEPGLRRHQGQHRLDRRAASRPMRPNWDGLLPGARRRPLRMGRLLARRPNARALQPDAGLDRHGQRVQHAGGLPGQGAQAGLRVDQPLAPPAHARGAGLAWQGLDRGLRAAAERHPLDPRAPPRGAARAALLRRREDAARAGFSRAGTRGSTRIRRRPRSRRSGSFATCARASAKRCSRPRPRPRSPRPT